MTWCIHLVEDEVNLNQVLTSYLQREGWQVSSFFNGEDARRAIGENPHLWILDIMLPDIDGFQLVKEIKAVSPAVPVIFISARDTDLDRVIGLEMGSDDYLPKPFLPRELVIRAGKLLERFYTKTAIPGAQPLYVYPPYQIDGTRRTVTCNGQRVDLTFKEFEVLLFLVQNQRQAFSRTQILNRVWGEDYFGTDRVVDDLIRRLRKKMPDLRIETIYGYGYRLVRG